jgi:hypothetical protein
MATMWRNAMRKTMIRALFSALALPLAATTTNLSFIADDYGKALAEAKERKLPMFVEVSAPW